MKRIVTNIIGVLCLVLAGVSCGGRNARNVYEKQIVVTIPPLKGLVAEIVGSDYGVECLLPSGSSPETYSPTARQIAGLSDAEFVFMVGTMPFEQELIKHIDNEDCRVVETSEGIALLTDCEHHHEAEHRVSEVDGCTHDHHSGAHSHHHLHHGDPHVWLSPDELKVIVDNIASEIIAAHPDSTKYIANYEQLKAKLEARKLHYAELLKNAHKSFLIYHPALGYLAEDYGLEQISLEIEGKSPTPSALANIVNKVDAGGVEVLLYQQEYPLDVVQPIAEVIGVKLVEINPLNESIISELDKIVATLANNYE